MPPSTTEPSWLAPLPGASVLELAGGDRVVAGSFGIAAPDGLVAGPARLQGMVRLAADGSVRWKRDCGPSCDVISLAAEPDGDLIAAGTFAGSLHFGDGPLRLATQANHAFVIRLDAVTGRARWVWTDRAWFGIWSQVTQVTLDAHGDVLAAGWFQKAIDLGHGFLRSDAWGEGFAAKLSGQSGALVWGTLMPGGSSAVHTALPLADGDALPVGYTDASTVVSRVSPEGKLRWVKRSEGAKLSAFAASSDRAGGVWIVGSTRGRARFGTAVVSSSAAEGQLSSFILHLDGRGEPLLARAFPDPEVPVHLQSVALLPQGGLAVAGLAWGPVQVGSFEIPARVGPDGKPRGAAFLATLDTSGRLQALETLPGIAGSIDLVPAGADLDVCVTQLAFDSSGSSRVAMLVLRWDGQRTPAELASKIPGPNLWITRPPDLRALVAAHRFSCPPGESLQSGARSASCVDAHGGRSLSVSWNANGSGAVGQDTRGQQDGTRRIWFNPTGAAIGQVPAFVDESEVAGHLRRRTEWWRPGQLKSVSIHDEQGRPDGTWTSFCEDGRPERESTWSHGALEDEVTRAQDGTVRERRHRTPDGILHDWLLWPNGKTEAEGSLDGVRRVGDWRFSYPDGATSCELRRGADGTLRATQYAAGGTVLGTVERAGDGRVRLTGSPIVAGRGDPCW